MTLANLGFGFFGFIFALSIYLLFFTKGDEAIVNRLEKDSEKKLSEEKFNLIIMGLDNFEKQVVKKVREQDGITQNTLKLRVDMSKAKLSQVLGSLENKGFIKREPYKKTMIVNLKIKL